MGVGEFGLGGEGLFGRLFVGFDKLFGLMDGEVPVDNVVEDGEVPLGVFDVDEGTGMGHADLPRAEGELGFGRKVEKAQVVGDGGAVFAYTLAELLVGELTLFDKGVVGKGYLHGVEVFALDILDECHFHHLTVGGDTDVGGEFGETSELRCTIAAFTGNELVFAVGHTSDGNGGDDSLFADGLR